MLVQAAGQHVGLGLDAIGRKAHLVGIGLDVSDELGKRLDGKRGGRQQRVGRLGHVRDRRKIGQRVEGQRFEERRAGRQLAGAGEIQGIAVRRCRHHELRGDLGRRAGLVDRNDGLAQSLRHADDELARQHVRSTRRIGNDELDRPRWVSLLGQRRCSGQHRCERHQDAPENLSPCLSHRRVLLGSDHATRAWSPAWCAPSLEYLRPTKQVAAQPASPGRDGRARCCVRPERLGGPPVATSSAACREWRRGCGTVKSTP